MANFIHANFSENREYKRLLGKEKKNVCSLKAKNYLHLKDVTTQRCTGTGI